MLRMAVVRQDSKVVLWVVMVVVPSLFLSSGFFASRGTVRLTWLCAHAKGFERSRSRCKANMSMSAAFLLESIGHRDGKRLAWSSVAKQGQGLESDLVAKRTVREYVVRTLWQLFGRLR